MATNLYQSASTAATPTLFAGPQTESIVTQEILVAPGLTLTRGTVLTRDDVTEVCSPISDVTGSPGDPNAEPPEPPTAGQAVWCVLADDIDTTDATGDTVAVGYTKGGFNREALTFGGSLTWQDCEAAARDVGIYMHPVVQRVEV